MKQKQNPYSHSFIVLFFIMTIMAVVLFYPVSSYALSKWQAKYDKSLKLFKAKHYNNALKEAQAAVKEKKNPYTLELTANILQFLKKYNSSNRYYKESMAMFISKANKNKSSNAPNNKVMDKFIDTVQNSIGLNYLYIGNESLGKNRIKEAISSYKKGMVYAKDKRIISMLDLNSAMAYENEKMFKPAIALADKVISINSKNPYAYFVKGKAEYELKEIGFSVKDFKTAASIAPSSGLFKNALRVAEKTKLEMEQKNQNDLNGIKNKSKNLFK